MSDKSSKFELNDPSLMVRESQIISTPKRKGMLPISRSAWRTLQEEGYVPKGVLLGPKIRAWKLSWVLDIAENGTGDRRVRGRRAMARAEEARAQALADIKAHARSQRNQGEAAKAAAQRTLKAAERKGEAASRPADTIPPGGRRPPRGLKAKARVKAHAWEEKAPPV
jgi:hypothetical protein